MKKNFIILLFAFIQTQLLANRLLLPMDEAQKNHLKAYGLTFTALSKGEEAQWLLNYRGGAFVLPYNQFFLNECVIRGIHYETLSEADYTEILNEIAQPESNMDLMKLEKAPKIAVYSPKTKQPWDDAVTLVLTYAEIPYTVIFDDEVLDGDLPKFDWLHLHHEDFTGQYGKFYASFHQKPWYQNEVREAEEKAKKYGFNKVSQLKLAVALKIKEFVLGGGFLFAMCAATDTYDIALSAEGTDICDVMFDKDGPDRQANTKLQYDKTFAFKDYKIILDPFTYEYSNIDARPNHIPATQIAEKDDYFQLFKFSAKWDPVPTMLTQNHEQNIKSFMGQTTSFKKSLIKPEVLIMGENKHLSEAKYVHGTEGKGFWTFYGGHDPEDYQHLVYEEPTDLNLHPNSPGYRLILNNILFPAAKKKKQKT